MTRQLGAAASPSPRRLLGFGNEALSETINSYWHCYVCYSFTVSKRNTARQDYTEDGG